MNSSAFAQVRTPARRPAGAPAAQPAAGMPPLRARLLELLPAAERVLVLGEADASFAEAYARRHPGVRFLRNPAAAAGCDLVVLPDGLGRLDADLPVLLARLAADCPPSASLCIAFADPAVPALAGLPADADHASRARAGSRAALAMLLMDAGWMPDAPDYTVAADDPGRIDAILVAATRPFEPLAAAPSGDAATARFAVVVPTSRPEELARNVHASPGLGEVQAPIYAIHDATSPADALETALPHLEADWVLLCHQDVYFPAGFGRRLDALLAAIPAEAQDKTLIGFVGMAADKARGTCAPAGFMIDRLNRMDHPASAAAVSIDEAALVLSRRSLHRIDPAMGWHLWATDLCLGAICRHEVFPQIVRLPLFHNSVNDGLLTGPFQAAADRLLQKYPDFGPIPTLCGTIEPAPAPPVAETAPAAPGRIVASAPAGGGCSVCGTAVAQWLPHPQIAARSEFMKLLDAVGSDLSVYQCPSCQCNDRDRHLWHYMTALGLAQGLGTMRVLHIAPERHIEALIASFAPPVYLRGDLHPQRSDHLRLDVEALPFEPDSFDLVICNHVLEHVANPARALAQFHRCLGPGGLLIAQTPYAPALKHTFEKHGEVSPAFARLFYGQDDHVRLFGADIVQVFRAAGFSGEPIPHAVLLPAVDARAHGVNAREPFFCFSK